MKCLFVGDICPTDENRALFAAGNGEELFKNTASLFAGKDFTFVNLECALTESEHRIEKFGPNLKAPPATAAMLKKLGVHCCGLSNNHVFDFGKEGALDTIRHLEAAGLAWTGFGENYEDSRKNYIVEKNGERLCVIAVCEHEYSYALEDRMGSRPTTITTPWRISGRRRRPPTGWWCCTTAARNTAVILLPACASCAAPW